MRGVWRRPSRVYYGRRRPLPPSEGGPPHGAGTITATGVLTGHGTKHATGGGTITATGALQGAGTKHATGAGSITATATLTGSGSGYVPGEAHFRFAIDWDGDGDFTGPGEDVTDQVLAKSGFSTEFGRDQARALSPPASGRATFTLNNISRNYSPDNPASPLADDLLPAREVLSTVELDGVTRALFRGHLDDFEVKVEKNVREVDCVAFDPLAKLKDNKVSTQLYAGIRTGEAINVILDAADWPADLRDLDVGATVIRWWWEEGTDAWDAILKLVNSEGPAAIVHADEDGRIVFRDRHHRILDAGSTTSQATLTDGANGYEPAFSGITYNHGLKDIVNHVAISVDERDPSPEPETVWESADLRNIGAGETLQLTVQTNEPVIDANVTFDIVTAGTATSTLLQTSGQALTLQITAPGSAIAIANIVVTAQPVAVRRTVQVQQEDTASRDKYGQRSLPYEAPWAGVTDAEAIAQIIVGARSERLPTVEILFSDSSNPLRMAQQFGRDLSDRVHLTEAETGLDTDFFIEKIAHRVSGGGFVATTFGCEKAAVQPTGVFTFNDSARGFNDGVFGSPGLDDPSNTFVFDQAGRGFNDGLFAT
ncbi:hypothetical protein [Actinomadura rugatobispora]|uniref:Calx-beta domain-containing protein n=1 Tax=Actinomadura rugatobispora TaxID=1994 RepID=A0ABW0ZR21_9ACTN|nr:hypothetical protein GCM10010200_036550 [Actinomadura rugatobispora]